MKWIREYFIKQALKKVNPFKKIQPTMDNIESIGIIAPSLVELNETKDVIMPLLGNNIRVEGFFYGEGSEAKEAFSYEDFSLSGKPKNNVAKFVSNKTDIIIASSEKLNIFSLYLLYLNPQSYSVGFYHENHTPYLDLMLAKEGMDQKQNVENLLKYLKQVILK